MAVTRLKYDLMKVVESNLVDALVKDQLLEGSARGYIVDHNIDRQYILLQGGKKS